MPVIIAHGQPKSGSTFLFAAATELCDLINGENIYVTLESCMGAGAPIFHSKLDAQLVEDMLIKARDKTLVIKTHDFLPDDVRHMIEDKRVRAFTSFRDPRDACRSMLDAGISDRAKGNNRWFASRSKVEELTRPISAHLRQVQTWIDCADVLALPYYIISNNQDYAVRLLSKHLGFGALGSIVAAKMEAEKKEIPEFHKGFSDRFLTDFSTEEIDFLNKAMAEQIATYSFNAKEKMAKLGHRMLHDRLVAMRQAALEARGVSEVL